MREDGTTLLPRATPASAEARPRRRRSLPASAAHNRLNDRLAVLLAAIVVLAAVPLGSNRPVWWLGWGVVIGFAAALHLWLGGRAAPGRRLRLTGHRALFLCGLGVVAMALVQALPLGPVLPASVARLPPGWPDEARQAISLMPQASLAAVLRLAAHLAFFALVLEVATRPERIRRFAWLLFLGIAAHAAWGLVALNLLGDLLLWQDKTDYRGMATGTFVNRNSYATFLGFGIVLGIALTLERAQAPSIRTSRRRSPLDAAALEAWGCWALVGLIATALVATQSRLGLAATGCGALLCLALMRARAGLPLPRVLLETAAVLLLVGGIALARGGTGLVDRMLDLEGDGGTRLDIYRQVAGMIATRPFSGFGLDAFAPAYELFRAPPVLANRVLEHGHNSYLTLWAELGLVAGSLPMLAGVLAGLTLLRRLRGGRAPALVVAALGVLVLGAVHSLGDFSLEIPANTLAFLAILGLGLASPRGAEPGG